jgi:hypothetical protein
MLVSHTKKFIFLKTVKTAGTSVEIFFEEFCTPNKKEYGDGEQHRGAGVSKVGIVGARGSMKKRWIKPRFYNHMPAHELRKKLGKEVWSEYFKFTVCRNPFDALVSQFWFSHKSQTAEMLNSHPEQIYLEFRQWLQKPRNNPNSHVYLIDGVVAVDYFIRFEDLTQGLTDVCERLGIEKSASNLQSFNSGIRPKAHVLDSVPPYFDSAAIEIVRRLYPFELNSLGYSLQDVS